MPDIRNLKMEEKSLVPKPVPEIESDTDPLPGTRTGDTIRTAGDEKRMSEALNTRDDLEVKDAMTSILLCEIEVDLQVIADVARQRTAALDVEPRRTSSDT